MKSSENHVITLQDQLTKQTGVSKEEVIKVLNALGVDSIRLPSDTKKTVIDLKDMQIALRAALTVVMC